MSAFRRLYDLKVYFLFFGGGGVKAPDIVENDLIPILEVGGYVGVG